jgi:fermentation-respiration switch protein FrsA (DUF1100 family)
MILIPLLVLAAVLPLLAVLSPRYFYRIAIGGNREPDPLPRWIETRGCEIVGLRSGDGLALRGRYLAAPGGGAATAILAHGYHGSGGQMSEYARFFYEELHYNVLIPDARGHGLSEGDYAGFGWHERLDWLRWIDWARDRAAGTALETGGGGIVLFGVSMGAATVMMTAGETLPPEVKAVIADCGYTSVEEELAYQLKQTYHISGPLGSWLLKATGRLTRERAGYGFEEASCLAQIKKSKTPTLFIHGDADTYVPFAMVFTLYEAGPPEKDLYIAKGAGHGLAYDTDPEEYRRRVRLFLEKYLP